MNICKNGLALLSAVSLCVLFTPLSASADYKTKFIAVPVQEDENGIITAPDGEKWFKAATFDDNKDYIISVKASDNNYLLTAGSEKNQEYKWHFFRRTMVTSIAPEYTALYSSSFTLTPYNNELYASSPRSSDSDMIWEHYGSTLRYNNDGCFSYLKYNESDDVPFSMTDDPSEAAQVDIYTKGDTLERCISIQPYAESFVTEGSGYSAPTFSVALSDTDIIADKITWFVDGNEYPCNTLMFTADELADRESGVHRVSCLVEAHDDNNVHYREKSSNALFVIAKGVVPDSFLTFSDVHEEYDLIGDAIGNILSRTNGYIPALIVCTGDLVNGPTPDSEKMLGKYYPQIVSQLGGIDTVFVSGNHDPGEAAAFMSKNAALGNTDNISASGGFIFNGENSQYNKDIKVYGINYDSEIFRSGSSIRYSYENIIGGVGDFLKKTSENYHGELVVISAHSGLHVLGINKGSVDRRGIPISSWIGENMYNIDGSYELASLINSYAEKYDMNIIYLFGHDHSRQEEELILTKGDTLSSPISYSSRSYESFPISFTYAHAGYLSSAIGCADKSFSFIYRNGDNFSYELISETDNSVVHTDIASLYHAEEAVSSETTSETTALSTLSQPQSDTFASTTSAKTNGSENKKYISDSPYTGTKAPIPPVPLICAFSILSAVLWLTKRK